MLAFSIDYYRIFFGATQSVELFCTYYLHDNEAKINGEGHRINLIIKMIEPEINDVYLRLQNTKKVQERVADKDFKNQVYEGAMYTPKTTEVSEKMKSLF